VYARVISRHTVAIAAEGGRTLSWPAEFASCNSCRPPFALPLSFRHGTTRSLRYIRRSIADLMRALTP
jgi:hypothetical protein